MRYILLLTLCEFLCLNGISQEKIKIAKNASESFIEQIEFYNESGQLISVFNLHESNPYENLNLPLADEAENFFGTKVYDVSNKAIRDRIPSFFLRIPEDEIQYINYLTSTIACSINSDFVCVTYNAFIKSPDYDFLSGSCQYSYVILNANGQIIKSESNLPGGASHLTTSKNGQFIIYEYVPEIYLDSYNGSTLRILDLNTEELLFENEVGTILGFNIYDSVIVFAIEQEYGKSKSIVFTGSVPALYSKVFSIDESYDIISCEADGFLMKHNGVESKLYYVNDFERLW